MEYYNRNNYANRKRKVMEAMAFLAAQGAAKSVAKGHTAAARVAARPVSLRNNTGMTARHFTVAAVVTLVTLTALVVSFKGLETLPPSLSDVLVTRILGLKTLHIARGILFYVLAYALVEFGEAYMPEDFLVDGTDAASSKRRRVPVTLKDR